MSVTGAARRILNAAVGPSRTRKLALGSRDVVDRLAYLVDPRGRRSARRIASFRDRFDGRRCFILGNGPSLRSMDLSPLHSEVTFGLNRIYLLFADLGFPTSFLVSVNDYVLQQCIKEISALDIPRFLSWRSRDLFDELEKDVIFVRSTELPGFSTDPSQGVWEGATVTYVALQLAFYMGFSEVVLIGVDHSFSAQGAPHEVVVSQGDDPDHFDPSYFGKGFTWQLPDLETSEVAYRMARRQFEEQGRSVVDATVGGQLEIFPKVRFEDLFV